MDPTTGEVKAACPFSVHHEYLKETNSGTSHSVNYFECNS